MNIVDYIKSESKIKNQDEIFENLIKQGFNKDEIISAFSEIIDSGIRSKLDSYDTKRNNYFVYYYAGFFAMVFVVLIYLTITYVDRVKLDNVLEKAGTTIYYDPIQTTYSGPKVLTLGGEAAQYFQPMADYNISGIAVSKRYYGNNEGLPPMDLCIIWGGLISPDVLPYLKFDQFISRHCAVHENRKGYINWIYVMDHFSNNHIIFANKNVEVGFSKVDKFSLVNISGYLININNPRYSWLTSLSRDDMGDGACETMYAKRVEVDGKWFE